VEFNEDDDLTFDIESNDDDTEVALIVRSPNGKKITQHEFIMALESYLHDVTGAEIYRRENGSSIH
jgi:hypothetical protein